MRACGVEGNWWEVGLIGEVQHHSGLPGSHGSFLKAVNHPTLGHRREIKCP